LGWRVNFELLDIADEVVLPDIRTNNPKEGGESQVKKVTKPVKKVAVKKSAKKSC
jgi:hypothetical protein